MASLVKVLLFCLAISLWSTTPLAAQAPTQSAWDEKSQQIVETWVERLRIAAVGKDTKLTPEQKKIFEGIKWILLWHRTIEFDARDTYKELLVTLVARSQKSKGDNLNHIIHWHMVVDGAPLHLWVRLLAEEMNPGGRLEHVLDDDLSIRAHLEGTLRSPFIRGLVVYLQNGLEGLPDNRTGLISYMFRSNPVMTAEIIMEELPSWFNSWYVEGKGLQLKQEFFRLKLTLRFVHFVTWGKYHRLPRDPRIEAQARSALAQAIESPLWLSRAVAAVVLERNLELRTPKSEKKLQQIVNNNPQDPHPVLRVLGRDLYRERLQKQKRQK